MKFAFAALVAVAAALIPAAQASSGINFTAEKFNRRDTAPAAAPAAPAKVRNPEFGLLLANEYLIRGGKGMPEPKDVATTYPDCKWKHYAGSWAWLDEHNVSCFLSPSYKYHAYSPAKPFDPKPSIERGACADTANPQDFPAGIPKYTISVPSLYFNNLYDRRCKVRAIVKVPKTDEKEGGYVLAWNGGTWNTKGDTGDNSANQGILIDTALYPKFLPKGAKDTGVLPQPVEWFLLDTNVIQ